MEGKEAEIGCVNEQLTHIPNWDLWEKMENML